MSATHNETRFSFLHIPKASNDYFTGYNEDWSSPIYFDVMANDVGNAKTLYSLDDGSFILNLLFKDTARAESTSTDCSKYGAKIWITTDGKVGYNVNTPAFQNKLQSLSLDETIVDSFTYAIRLGNGLFGFATTSIEFAGRNDLPVITSATVTGSVTEKTAPTGNTLVNGIIDFKDVDLSDVHSISATGTPIGSVLGSLTANLIQDTSHVTGLGGKVAWRYTVAESALEYLSAGQTKVEPFNISISDNHGGVLTQTISITLTGINSAPIANADTNSGDAGVTTPLMAFHWPSSVRSCTAHSTKISAADVISEVHAQEELHFVRQQSNVQADNNNTAYEMPHSVTPNMLTDMLGTLTTGYLNVETLLV